MERVTKSADACLTALNIMTSAHMPKAVYIEDVIERVLQFTKFHLQNTLYPQYDPVYRVDPHGGEDKTSVLFFLMHSLLCVGRTSLAKFPDKLWFSKNDVKKCKNK